MIHCLIDSSDTHRCFKLTLENGLDMVVKEQSCSGFFGSPGFFLSSSVGCKYKCMHCYLKHNNAFNTVGVEDQVKLFKNAIMVMKDLNYDQYYRGVSLRFMGQGDALENPLFTQNTIKALEKESKINHISFSTIFPKFDPKTTQLFKYCIGIAPTRAYLSVGSFITKRRRKILPKALDLNSAIEYFHNYLPQIQLRLHWTPIAELNASISEEIWNAISLFKKYNYLDKVRLIKYNSVPASRFHGVNDINDVLNEFINQQIPCDVLPSIGTEIKAACGMFG
jgi:adenine C2-methylase RlmN of 23S rRNA A2503 and tRNA A37